MTFSLHCYHKIPGSCSSNLLSWSLWLSALTPGPSHFYTSAKIIYLSYCSDHMTPLYRLPLHSRIQCKLLGPTFTATHGFAPPQISCLISHYVPACNFWSFFNTTLYCPKLSCCPRRLCPFSLVAPYAWNYLPTPNVHNAELLSCFKSSLKRCISA